MLLADKAKRFHLRLRAQIPDGNIREAAEIRAGLRRQLPSNIFVQFLAGPDNIREGWFGNLLKFIVWMTLAIGPILLLLLLQIQFLPYHHSVITWTHRIVLVVDLLLVWWLWQPFLSGRGELGGWRWWISGAAPALCIAATFVAIGFSWTVATFPGEWQERPLSFVASIEPASVNQWLFFGTINETTRSRESWFSNTLVLPRFNIYEALKIDDPKKVEWKDHIFDLSGRRLEGAVFDLANLAKADLFDAHLEGASLRGTQLQGANLERAHLQSAQLYGVQLQGALLDGAQLQGADLGYAQLQGASLAGAQLQGAILYEAYLLGAGLFRASLKGALLQDAQLQGADLGYAQLQGASLDRAQLQGANLKWSLHEADLTAASMNEAIVWRAAFPQDLSKNMSVSGLNWRAEFFDYAGFAIAAVGRSGFVMGTYGGDASPWTSSSYEALRRALSETIPAGDRRKRALERVEVLDCAKTDGLATCGPRVKEPNSVVETRKRIESGSVGQLAYRAALSATLEDLVCKEHGDAIHILRGLIKTDRIRDAGPEAAKLVDRIQSKECPVSAVLTEEDKARLREQAKKAAPPAQK